MIRRRKKERKTRRAKQKDTLKAAGTESTLNRFKELVERIQEHPDFVAESSSRAPYGYLGERFIIGECTAINGGVYLGVPPHEAIVVDDEKYPVLYSTYMKLMMNYSEEHKKEEDIEAKILPFVFDLTTTVLCFSIEGVNKLHKRKAIETDQKISLDTYINEGVGIARHQVLLAAYLLEKLKTRGFLEGTWYIDGQFVPSAPYAEKLIYTGADGTLYPFEPTAMNQKAPRMDYGLITRSTLGED